MSEYPESTRSLQVRLGKQLEVLTILWNSLEAIIAIGAGVLSGSIALVGFGIDSVIEVSSGLALVWRLSMDSDSHGRERLERLTLKIVGWSFIALSIYVLVEAMAALWGRKPPSTTSVGIALAGLSLVIMPMLARAKRRVAAQIRSAALHADSRQTDICAYLSAILLAGLLLNAILGWWWADPVAAIVMVPIITREGIEALQGRTCCDDESD